MNRNYFDLCRMKFYIKNCILQILFSLCWTRITIQRWMLDLAITWTYTAGWSTELSLFYRRKVTANARILITHFPLSYTTERVRSKSKKTLMQVMTTNNMTVLLAGHTHRELIVHRNTTLEIHPWAIKRGSVFHRLFGDHAFNLEVERPKAIVTYPVKKKILSHRTDFSIKTFNMADVRVVLFSQNPNLSITVTCKWKSKEFKSEPTLLKFQRVIRRNQSLYSTPLKQFCDPCDTVNQSNSTEFVLAFSGDYDQETVFVVGNYVRLSHEKLYTDVSSRKALLVVGVICWILILITWCWIQFFSSIELLY